MNRAPMASPVGLIALTAAAFMASAHATADPPQGAPGTASPARTVMSCKLSKYNKVDLVATPQGTDLYTLSTRLRGKTEPAFAQALSGATPRGAMAIRLCLDGVMVYALKLDDGVHGTVLRQHPGTHKLERLEFRDAALPYGLYVNNDEMRVVVPARGGSQYTVYSSRTGQGRPSNMLPSGRLFTFYALQ